jgi:hypothetical protein
MSKRLSMLRVQALIDFEIAADAAAQARIDAKMLRLRRRDLRLLRRDLLPLLARPSSFAPAIW